MATGSMMLETDFLIVGAGIAGASIAYRLAPFARVTLIEMEDQAGYHTTGRSAAFYAETYGGPSIQPLTTASKSFFYNPPIGFVDTPLISKLGAIHVFRADQEQDATVFFHQLKASIPSVCMLTDTEVIERLPHLQKTEVAGGIYDSDCSSLDVAALHQGFIKGARRKGAKLIVNARLSNAQFVGGRWEVETNTGIISAKTIVNCAGAWADLVAEISGVRPIGLEPLRRTVVKIDSPVHLPFDGSCPITMYLGQEHYFKPEGNGYLLSPGDEVLTPPSDVQPEQEDIARAVFQFEQATGSRVQRVDAKWAGLRTFAKDRNPVIGFADDNPAFFWSVGQGGFGIQTAPAWSELAAETLLGSKVSEVLQEKGIRAEIYNPARFFHD